MFKLLFILRTSTSYGAGAAFQLVEFDSVREAQIAYDEAQRVGINDMSIIKLYR